MSADPATRPHPLMWVPDVAALFQVDPETVRVWVRAGKLKARRNPGGLVLVFRRVDVEGLLADEPELAAQNKNEPAPYAQTKAGGPGAVNTGTRP